MTDGNDGRLARLLGYLEADPNNPNLLADAVQAALDADDLDRAGSLGEHLLEVAPAAFPGRYLASVVAMRRRDFAAAAAQLERLVQEDDQPAVRFNLAWSQAMLGDKGPALAHLDERTTDEIAGAAMLKVQLMHEAGQFEEGFAFGQAALERHPADGGLLGAMATLAMDLEHTGLAREYAAKAGDHPEALAASGMLDLYDGSVETARALFDRSLATRPHNPRAWLGRGMAGLARQDNVQAAMDLDRGAQQFGSHIGSWIAAGWGHFIAGDLAAAQERFERARSLDPNFAESHGSLAVIDAASGRTQDAHRKVATALRLDHECVSAVFAGALLSADPAQARETMDRIFNTPIDERGTTITSFMAGLTRPTVH